MEIANSKLKVAVLMGGIGEERDISIQSGNCVAQALKEAGLNVVVADIGPDNLDILEDGDIDVFFLALHGRFGEDGQLQQILEDKSLLYTGSGPAASKLAFDKLASKKCFAKAGVDTPAVIKWDPVLGSRVAGAQKERKTGTQFDAQRGTEELKKELLQLSERFVVKPVRQGSTIGVSIADDPKSALVAAQQCLSKFGDCMIEEFIPGRDITVGILCDQVLPIIEIKSKTGFYDYQAKYIDGQTEFLFDTIDDSALIGKINAAALDCFNALGCREFGRVDFILGDEEKVYALEVNNIPGLTEHSLLPKAAAKAGLSMSDLCVRIIEAAYSSLVARRS